MPSEWRRTLTAFDIDLKCNGAPMDRGRAGNVMEGPLSTLRYVMDLLGNDRANPPLAAGEIVTTGTLTKALPVKPGETWSDGAYGRGAGRDFGAVFLRLRCIGWPNALRNFGAMFAFDDRDVILAL